MLALSLAACTFPETAVLRFKFEQPIIGSEVEGVGELWEIPALAVADGDGAINVKTAEPDHERVCGYTRDRFRPWDCTPIVFGCQVCAVGNALGEHDRAVCLAHEAGHVAGLGHDDGETNVMFERIGRDTTDTTDEQRTAVRERAALMELCP